MRNRATFLTFLLGASACWGLKLDDLVALAQQRNPDILAAQKKYEAALLRPAQAGSLPDPMFSPGWNSNGNPLPGAGIGTNPTSNIGFSVAQQIPYPGKRRLRSELAAKEADVEAEEVRIVRLGVVARLEEAYFRLHHAYEELEVLDRNRELLKKLLAVTEISYSSGKAAQQDVFKAQLQLSLIETKAIQQQRERRLREAEINTLLDRPIETPLDTPAESHSTPLTKSLAELQAMARDSAPLRARDRAMIRAADVAVDVARRDLYPNTTLSGGYYNQAGMPAFYTFRADIAIPLYSRTKQRLAIAEQALMAAQTRHSDEATAQSLAFRIADDYSSAETSLRLLDLYSNTVLPQARLTVDSSMTAYETGKVDLLSVLNNYTAVLDYEMNYHEEMLNYHLALVRLEEATGVRLTEGH